MSSFMSSAMSMRALAVLIGLLAVGNTGALAMTSPLVDDPQDDLLAPDSGLGLKPTTPAPDIPSAANPAGTAEPTPATPPASTMPSAGKPAAAEPSAAKSSAAAPAASEQPSIGNPLWAIPLQQLSATRDRPLFSPSRRPAVTAIARPAPVAVAAQPAKPPEPKPQFLLLGVVAAENPSEAVGLFMNATEKVVIRLKMGENYKGWTLRAVRPRQATLVNGLDNAVLTLPKPEMKAAGNLPGLAPAALSGSPMSAPPMPAPPMPARPMPPSAAGSAMPANPVTVTGSMQTPMPNATIVIEHPFINLRPLPANLSQTGKKP